MNGSLKLTLAVALALGSTNVLALGLGMIQVKSGLNEPLVAEIPVTGGPERLREAAKHGFKRAIVPKGNAPKPLPPDMEVHVVTRLEEALEVSKSFDH